MSTSSFPDAALPPTQLGRVRSALAATSDRELQALRAASEQITGFACGLFAWLEHITGWEIDRRDQQKYLLRFPSESMDPEEVPDALMALGALRVTFRTRDGSPEIDELLSAAAELVEWCGTVH